MSNTTEHLLSWELMDNIRSPHVGCSIVPMQMRWIGRATQRPRHRAANRGRSPLPGSLDDHHKLACGCEQALVAFRANRTRDRRCQAHGWTHLGPTARLRGPRSPAGPASEMPQLLRRPSWFARSRCPTRSGVRRTIEEVARPATPRRSCPCPPSNFAGPRAVRCTTARTTQGPQCAARRPYRC